MFSINFQRNFFSFCKSSDSEESSENSRLYSALNIFGLSNRIIHNMDNLTAEDISIDYKNVIPILEEQRRDSIEYLENKMCIRDSCCRLWGLSSPNKTDK